MIDTFREFLADESGNATTEYTLVATVFAAIIITMMMIVSNTASGQIASTDTGLNNRNGVTN